MLVKKNSIKTWLGRKKNINNYSGITQSMKENSGEVEVNQLEKESPKFEKKNSLLVEQNFFEHVEYSLTCLNNISCLCF